MEKVEYRLKPEQKKEMWGEGRWVDEPDYVEFEHNKAQCLIRRVYCPEGENGEFIFGGHLCGYVLLPENHPFRNKGMDVESQVHQGITFNGYFLNDLENYYIGFDCGHMNDIIPSLQKLYKEINEKIKWFGFVEDSFFKPTYKDIEYVKGECKKLADEVVAATL